MDAGRGEKFWECVDLRSLDLSHNLLEVLPDGEALENICSLEILLAAHNRFARMPFPHVLQISPLSPCFLAVARES
jgi:hypothetical protein